MTRFQCSLVAALGLAGTYELTAAFSHRWLTISQLTWRLEQHHPLYASLIAIGFVVLGVHLFVRNWKRG